MLQHVTREVSRSALSPCIEFYALLGFSRVETPAGIGDRAVWLARAGTQIHLCRATRRNLNPVTSGSSSWYEGGILRLGAAGHAVEPRREHWGAPRAHVRDPAGILVEVMAASPGRSSRADAARRR